MTASADLPSDSRYLPYHVGALTPAICICPQIAQDAPYCVAPSPCPKCGGPRVIRRGGKRSPVMLRCQPCDAAYSRSRRRRRRHRKASRFVARDAVEDPDGAVLALVALYGGWERLASELPPADAAQLVLRIVTQAVEQPQVKREPVDEDLIDAAIDLLLDAGWSVRAPGKKRWKLPPKPPE